MKSLKNNDYIDLMEVAKGIWVYKLPIIALAVVMAMIAVVRVQFFVDDTYVSSGVLYVSNRNAAAEEDQEVSKSDIDTAISMSNTYMEILKTRSFLSEVEAAVKESGELDKKYSWRQIKSMTSISMVNETQLLQISVRAKSPDDAYVVAKNVINTAPQKLKSVFKNGEVEIVDNAVLPSGAVDKGVAGEAVKGLLIGLIIGIAAVVVLNLFDTKVHKSEDVSKRYNISVLGEIAQ